MKKQKPFPVNKKYTHFAVRKSDGKIVNAWETITDIETLKHYAKTDLEDLDINPNDVKILSKKHLIKEGINPFDWANWYKHGETDIAKCGDQKISDQALSGKKNYREYEMKGKDFSKHIISPNLTQAKKVAKAIAKAEGIKKFTVKLFDKEKHFIGKEKTEAQNIIHLRSGTLKRKQVPNDLQALTGYKYTDTDTDLSRTGKVVEYWNSRGFKKLSSEYRKPALQLKENFFSTQPFDTLVNVYQWKGIEFGNWTTNEDRYNYLIALVICSHDLNRVLQFKDNLGMWHTIHIAFGARGQGRALAHFEPSTFAINLTRYKRADKKAGTKEERFFSSGGIGSLAHEYGHALDFFFGQYVEKTVGISLSNAHSTNTTFDINGKDLHAQMARVIHACIWKKQGKELVWTNYYKNLKARFGTLEYWFRHAEIWARLFEQYIQHELTKKHIHNTFLAKMKYADSRYLPANEFKRVLPLVKKLLQSMSKTAQQPARRK